jgi:hypothetical protein
MTQGNRPLVPSGDPLAPTCLDDLLAGQDERAAVWFNGQILTRGQIRGEARAAAAALQPWACAVAMRSPCGCPMASPGCNCSLPRPAWGC